MDSISVIITSYKRPGYLERAINSIHEFADMPFELIVHDDGSNVDTINQILTMKDKIDVLILNPENEGLNKAVNRSVKKASSDYILFLCDDCWVRYPCFRDIFNVLRKEYVGWICPGDNRLLNNVENLFNLIVPDNITSTDSFGSKFYLTNNLLGGYTQAFRRDVWENAGGWEERASTGRSDNIFLFKILKAGYWKAILPGESRIELANNETNYIPTAPLMKIQTHDFEWENEQLYEPAGLANINYWFDYFFKIFNTKFDNIFTMEEIVYDINRINWKIASIHGQNKWRKQIENDFR